MQAQRTSVVRNGEVSRNLVRWLLFQDGRLRCAWCACPLTQGTVTRDHLAPRRRGVKWTRENLVPACASCNHRRGRTPVHVWVREFGRIPLSTVWMLYAFSVAHPNAARRQGVTPEFLATVPVYRDTDAVLTTERRSLLALERELDRETKLRVEAKKAAAAELVVA